MASQKRRALSLEEQVQVIKSSERGESSRSIAERLGVGRTRTFVKLHFVQYIGCTYIPLFITM